MSLLDAFITISEELTPMFKQERTALRAQRLLLSNLLCVGRHWLTRVLCATGRDQHDWSADYRFFSRSRWKLQDLFTPVIKRSLTYLQAGEPICIAGDETKIRRAGRKVKRSRWISDPLSVDCLPVFIVASYSFLLRASLEAYGAKRTDAYLQPPLWRRKRSRPSCEDLLALIRREAMEHPERLEALDADFRPAKVLVKAAA